MATGLIDIMKRAALDAVDNSKVADMRVGTVVSVSPLQVQITTQFVLPDSVLIVPQHLTNYTVSVSVEGLSIAHNNSPHKHQLSANTYTEEAGCECNPQLTGLDDMKLTIKNALKVGDRVALLRRQGGQSYYILDRI